MKGKRRDRWIAWILSVVLCMSMLPVSAGAAELVYTPILEDGWENWTDVGEGARTADDGVLCLYDGSNTVNGATYTALNTEGKQYEVTFRARLDHFNAGPQSSAGDLTSFGMQLLLPTKRVMFALEEKGLCASSTEATWGTTLAYPEEFDVTVWHEYTVTADTETDAVEIWIDGESVGTAGMQPRTTAVPGIKFYVRGNSGENTAEAWVDDFTLKIGEEAAYSDDFTELSGDWAKAETNGTMPEIQLMEDALILEDDSGSAVGKTHTLALEDRQTVSILFRARLDTPVAAGAQPGGAASLALQLQDGAQKFDMALTETGILVSDEAGAWAAELTYPAQWDALAWQEYQVDIDRTAQTASVYAGGELVGTGKLYDDADGTARITVSACGAEGEKAAAIVSDLRVGYFEESALPSWEADAAITVTDRTSHGFTVAWPAADKAETYTVALDGEEQAAVSACSYTFEDLPYTTEPLTVTVAAHNDSGDSGRVLEAEVNLAYDPDSGVMDVRQVVAGKNNGGDDPRYSNYRIPGIVVTKQDTVIMYYEARTTGSDWADMDIQMFRSTDGGETWGEPICLAAGSEVGKTMNNPIMIVGNDNTLHLLYCVEYGTCGTCNDAANSSCAHGCGVFYRQSKDDGLTWSEAVNISDSTGPDIRNVIATGPGHGICLEDGTLIATVWLVLKEDNAALTSHHPGNVSTLYSTDNGETWQLGEIVPNPNGVADPNETVAVQLEDGRVMLNIRSGGGGYRAIATSPNGYSDWEPMAYDTRLIDPTCFGSTVKYDVEGDPYTVLMVNCESKSSRSNLVVKGSTDGGETWSIRKVIDPGAAGYSDIAVDSKGTIYVLYEVNAGVTCNLARLNYTALTEDNLTKLESLTVSGADAPLEFDPNVDTYILNAVVGSEIRVTAAALSEGASITINGSPYAEGSVYTCTAEIGMEPLEIVVKNGGLEKTYTLRLLPKAPSETIVMHLTGDEDFSDSTIYQNDAQAEKVTIDPDNKKFGAGSFAFDVNDSDTLMQVSPTNGMDLASDDFTVAGWINVKALTGQQILFWYGGAVAGAPQWWCRTNGAKLQFNVASDGTETTIATADNVLSANEWIHVAVVRQGVHQYIYVNGQKVAEGQSDFVRNVSGTDALAIGRSRGNQARIVNGNMDEVVICNYALSESDLQTLMTENKLASASCDITYFAIDGVPGEIEGDTITVTLGRQADLTALQPQILVSEGAAVSPASGETQDFSQPVMYTVTAENGNQKTYTVKVQCFSGEKEILSFALEGHKGVIAGDSIQVVLSKDHDLTALIPEIVLSEGASISPALDVPQDFTRPVSYTVTAADGTAQTYTVSAQAGYTQPEPVLAEPAGEGDRAVTFNFLGDSITYGQDPVNAGLRVKTYHEYLAEMISLESRNYGVRGSTISVLRRGGDRDPFTVRYLAMERDADVVFVFGGTNDYGVVQNAPFGTWSDTEDTTFLGGLRVLIEGLILQYPDTQIVFMTPIHRANDAKQNSVGKTLADYVDAIAEMCGEYGIPVLDAYHAEEMDLLRDTQQYIADGLHPSAAGHQVMADWIYPQLLSAGGIRLPSDDASIQEFTIGGACGMIAEDTITITVPAGTDVSALSPEITVHPGAVVSPASGETQDFSQPVMYTVTAENGNTKEYTVTVTVETPSSGGGSSSSYRVTAADAVNGTVKISSTRPTAGSTVKVTLSPKDGYKAAGIKVTLANGDEVSVTDKGNGEYTFKMPRGNVTVTASFIEDTGLPFADVSADAWYFEAARYVYENELMNGTSDTAFAPNANLTRAMMVTVLWRMDGGKQVDTGMPFADVAADSWYAEAVRWAAGEGIVSGVDAAHFAPDSAITREQLAAILYRYAGSETTDGDLSGFSDSEDAGSWAVDALSWCVEEGILTGVDDTTLDPQGTATRAQIAAILMRFAER